MRSRTRAWPLVLLVLFAGAVAAQEGDSGRLPRLALDDVPAGVRATLEDAERTVGERPDDPAAAGRLAMLLHAYEQHALADQYYAQARRLEPQSQRWTYLGGVVAAELGEHDRAAGLLRASLAIDGTYLPARLALANVLFAGGRVDESRAEYERLIADHPELPPAHFGLGRAASARGDSEAAAGHYQRAIDASPLFGKAHYALALVHRNTGRLELARAHLDAYRKLGAREPAVPDPLLTEVKAMRSTARDLITEGARLGSEGRLAEAVAVHLKALDADPAASQAHVNLISLYGRMGQVEQAEAHYRKALTLDSNLAAAHYNYGVLLASTGRRAEARDAFLQAIAVDPFHAPAHNNLGALFAGAGEHERAAAHFRQALAADPQHTSARFGLAGVLLSLGQTAGAIAELERLLESGHADTPRHTYALARAWLAHGNRPKAEAYAREALKLALRLGQTELAARIERGLQQMAEGR